MIHNEPHPMAGKTVLLGEVATDPRMMILEGVPFRVEDWVDRVDGGSAGSWHQQSNWATMHYATRQLMSTEGLSLVLPGDDEVVYGKIGSLGHCVHAIELGEQTT